MDTLGIVFTGGEGPEPQAIGRLLNSLQEAALIVAADSGLHLAEAAGLQPDWITGDMDSIDGEEALRRYAAEKVIRHAAEKDFTDTELAASLLWEKGCTEVWIIGGGGGRIDHLLGIRDLFERKRFPRRWITAAEDMFCIEDGGQTKYGGVTQAIDVGGLVSVFPLGQGPWKAESRGLKWPLGNVRWERGRYGLSNVAVVQEITVSAQQGRFLVIFPAKTKEEMCRR